MHKSRAFSKTIFTHTLQLLRVSDSIECLITFKNFEMNNTTWWLRTPSYLFALNIIIKDTFFIACNDILENQLISLPLKMICLYGYAILFILFTKSMRNQNAQCVYCSHQRLQIMDFNALRWSAISRLLLRRLHSTNPYLPNPSARAGYDTRSISKRSLTGLNSEFSFS